MSEHSDGGSGVERPQKQLWEAGFPDALSSHLPCLEIRCPWRTDGKTRCCPAAQWHQVPSDARPDLAASFLSILSVSTSGATSWQLSLSRAHCFPPCPHLAHHTPKNTGQPTACTAAPSAHHRKCLRSICERMSKSPTWEVAPASQLLSLPLIFPSNQLPRGFLK